MFRMFQYILYQVSGRLDDYDPTQDMLVRPKIFLTWRRFDQIVPTGGVPYAGAVKDRKDSSWMIWRFNDRLYHSDVDDWLEHLLEHLSPDGSSLGAWQPSEFIGMIAKPRSLSDHAAYEQKLRQMEKFFRCYLNGQNAPFRGGYGPTAGKRWKYVLDWMLPCLLGDRGQVLQSNRQRPSGH